jgi:hypothetical protein
LSYLNVDDGMGDHPKIDRLSDAAFRLHITAMLYASQKGTDGLIMRTRARILTVSGNDAAVTELINAGIWHDVGNGCDSKTCLKGDDSHYVIHDYLQWNHSAHWWSERRKKDQERQAEWRAKKGLPEKKTRRI